MKSTTIFRLPVLFKAGRTDEALDLTEMSQP